MEPWYKVVTPRKEVREGRSFNPDEFAIALDQVVALRAPADYQDPVQFFSRTCFTQALCENSGMVLRRLAGRTDNAAPVQTLITQMGGGKTHMLTTLWHLTNGGEKAGSYPGVAAMMKAAGLSKIPDAKVAVYVGTAWDPQEGSETPWIHMARQLAGEEVRKFISLWFGLAMVLAAFWVDVRSRRTQDYAFWLYLFGVLTFWGGLSLMDSGSEWGKLAYCGINVAMILIGAVLGRRVFAVFGGLGVAGYLGHLSWRVFKDSLIFPFALSVVGLAIIWLGVLWQRREAEWSARLRRYLPAPLRELIEARAVR